MSMNLAQYLPAPDRLRPFGDARYIDVTQAPYNADNTGARDATAALVAAFDAVVGITADAQARTVREIEALPGDGHLPSGVENRKEDGKVKCIFPSYLPYLPAIYLPAGTYLVSDIVSYSLDNLANSLGSELNRQIRIFGDGAAATIIRLADATPGFDGPEPRPVVTVMRGRRSNVAMSNYVRDLSIDTGRDNPGAIGLDFFCANTGAVRDVVVRSADGRGHAGVQLDHGGCTGALLERVRIEGFDTGLAVSVAGGGTYAAAEGLTFTGQRKQCIHVGSAWMSLHDVTAEVNVPLLRCDHPQGSTVLLDATANGSGPRAIEHEAGALYVSNLRTAGYDSVLGTDEGEQDIAGGHVRELVLPRSVSLEPDAEPMPRLPVEHPPRWDGLRDGETRCGVRAFGAKGDGQHDDAPAIQAALDSGAAEIVFEPGHYMLDAPVTIGAGVRRVDFSFVDLVAGDRLAASKGQGAFVIAEDSDEPLLLEALFAWELWRGEHHSFDHACRRTVVIRDMHTQTSPLYDNSVPGGKVFIENICCTTGVVPGTPGHGRACVSFHGQRAWARQLDPERGEPMVLNDGGDLWVLGFKTEDAGVAFHTIDGGRTEVLGGMVFSGRKHSRAFVLEDSQGRFTAASSGLKDCYHGTAVEQRRGQRVLKLPADDLPRRTEGGQYHLPLFRGAVR